MRSFFSVLHVINSLHSSDGGPSRSAINLVDAMSEGGEFKLALLTQCIRGELSRQSSAMHTDLMTEQSSHKFLIRMGIPIYFALRRLMSSAIRPNLIHVHGLWNPSIFWAMYFATKLGIPLVIHPRGMLEPWALSQKSWRKKIAFSLYLRTRLGNAKVLIATSMLEYQNMRAIGLKAPIAIIPNGVNVSSDEGSEFQERSLNNPFRTALFLSRIHPKKGLINLIEAWALVRPVNWRLIIAGPDNDGYLEEALLTAKKYGIDNVIRYVGEVDGGAKDQLYQSSDLFILPTYSENFGLVVAEALSHGVPVITTKGAPWADLPIKKCGWWIDIGVRPLEIALRQAMSLSDSERHHMGYLGREYVREQYSWITISKNTIDVYKWILGSNLQPKCVYLN